MMAAPPPAGPEAPVQMWRWDCGVGSAQPPAFCREFLPSSHIWSCQRFVPKVIFWGSGKPHTLTLVEGRGYGSGLETAGFGVTTIDVADATKNASEDVDRCTLVHIKWPELKSTGEEMELSQKPRQVSPPKMHLSSRKKKSFKIPFCPQNSFNRHAMHTQQFVALSKGSHGSPRSCGYLALGTAALNTTIPTSAKPYRAG